MRSNRLHLGREEFFVDNEVLEGYDLMELPIMEFNPWVDSTTLNDLYLEDGMFPQKFEIANFEIKKESQLTKQIVEPLTFPKIFIKKEPKDCVKNEQPIDFLLEEQPTLVKSEASIEKFKCSYCPKQYKHKRSLNSHILSHQGPKLWECATCLKTFPTKHSLKRHSRIHSGRKSYQCDKCSKAFVDKSSLTKHLKRQACQKSFNCLCCKETFSRNDDLQSHLRTAHKAKKSFQCLRCQKTFHMKSQINFHYQTFHTDKPFKCRYCCRSFSRESHLNSHFRIHTGEPHKWRLKCDRCSKPFNCKSRLNIHLRSHTGEKPYKCTQCTKRFPSKGNLTRHIKGHNNLGGKHHTCSYCFKSYAHYSSLNAHLVRIHGLKPYICFKCENAFALKKNLDRHLGMCKVHPSNSYASLP